MGKKRQICVHLDATNIPAEPNAQKPNGLVWLPLHAVRGHDLPVLLFLGAFLQHLRDLDLGPQAPPQEALAVVFVLPVFGLRRVRVRDRLGDVVPPGGFLIRLVRDLRAVVPVLGLPSLRVRDRLRREDARTVRVLWI